MRIRDFRIGWRVLVSEPAYSLVVVAGLALGFAACILLLGFVHYSFNYDSAVPDSDRVYVLKHRLNFIPAPRWMETMPFGFRDAVMQSGMAQTATVAAPREAVATIDGRKRNVEVMIVDPDFANIFAVKSIQGDLRNAVTRPEGMAVTLAAAVKLFGHRDVFGKQLTIDGKLLTIMALLPDHPDNTVMPYGLLIGMQSIIRSDEECNPNIMETWMNIAGRVYATLRPGVSPQAFSDYLQAAADRSPWGQIPDANRFAHIFEVSLGTLRDAYFDGSVANSHRSGPRGDRQGVLGLAIVALLILLLAVANFVNLATLRVMRRRREIGMRKTLGASGAQVLSLFVAESLIVALFAAALGIVLAWLLLPLLAELVDRRLDHLLSPMAICISLAGALVVGMLSSAYPAWVALRMHPNQALGGRGSEDTAAGLAVRRLLTVLQFAAAMGLCAATLAVGWQTAFALRRDVGFDPTPLLLVDLPAETSAEKVKTWHAALMRLPGVVGVAGSASPVGDPSIPGRPGVHWITELKRSGAQFVPLLTHVVSPEFPALYQLRPIAGTLFDPAESAATLDEKVLLSASAVRAFGFAKPEDAIGQMLESQDFTVTVVGVVPELRTQSLHEAASPAVYSLLDSQIRVTTIRSNGERAALMDAVASQWEQHFAGKELNMRAAASVIAANYNSDIRLFKLMVSACAVAVLLAAFGIYVLAAYTVQRRHREIALRKLHGAGKLAIVRLIAKEFSVLLGLGALLGLPLALLAIEHYLAGFVEHAPMGSLPLLAAAAMTAALVVAASARHTRVAMQVAPARVLREE